MRVTGMMSRSCVWLDAFICVTWIIHVNDMTHSYVWHDSFICDVWHDSFIWLIYMCDMTHSYCDMTRSYVWQAFDLGRLPPPSRTESDVQRTNSDSTETESEEGISESCHTYKWVVSHTWMSHGPIAIAQRQSLKKVSVSHVTQMNESCHTYGGGMLNIWISHVTRINGSCHTHGWVTDQ